MKAGVEVAQRLMAINPDANVKLGHYKSSGGTITDAYSAAGLTPQLDEFFGKAIAAVAARQGGGATDAGNGQGECASLLPNFRRFTQNGRQRLFVATRLMLFLTPARICTVLFAIIARRCPTSYHPPGFFVGMHSSKAPDSAFSSQIVVNF